MTDKRIIENILFGMEKINQINRILLWEIAKTEQIGPIQILFIEFIWRQPGNSVTISELANEFNLKKPTVSDSIRNLEEKGFLIKERSQEDSRVYYLSLTPRGEDKISRIRETFSILSDVIRSFTDQEKETISSFFIRFILEMQNKGIIPGFRICMNCRNLQSGEAKGSWICRLTGRSFSVNEMILNCRHYVTRSEKESSKEAL